MAKSNIKELHVSFHINEKTSLALEELLTYYQTSNPTKNKSEVVCEAILVLHDMLSYAMIRRNGLE